MCESVSEHDELMALVARQQKADCRVDDGPTKSCHSQLAESERRGRRQAAPFSKGRRSGKPKRPGRKPGTGLFSYRKPPSADEVTEPVVESASVGGHMPWMWRQTR